MARIAVLDCATLDGTGLERYESIGKLAVDWLAPYLPEVEFCRIAVAAGEDLPKATSFSGYVVPGSEKGVYDQTPWMAPMCEFLREIRAVRRPLLGICFGHQLMAHAFGGTAAKTDAGLCVGARQFTVEGEVKDLHVMHQDQVLELPAGAQCIGRADYCPNGVIAYEFPALSFQFHPEYTAGFMRDALVTFRGNMLDLTQTEAAMASIESADIDAHHIGQWVAKFLLTHLSSGD